QPGGNNRFVERAALSLGLRPTVVGVHDLKEIEAAITSFSQEPRGGLIVPSSPITALHRKAIINLAAERMLPAIYGFRFYVQDGGLLSYGADKNEQYRGAARYIDRILKGAKPADLPVQQPIKYELVVNAKTAKALGLDIPLSILMHIDEVI